MNNSTVHNGLGTLLTSLQLADSAFPSGFYTLSHGLEGFLQAGRIDQHRMPEVLADLLRYSVGPTDATAVALTHRAVIGDDWSAVVAIDQRLHATKLNKDQRLAAIRTGRQMFDVAQQAFPQLGMDKYADLLASGATLGMQTVVAGVIYALAGVHEAEAVAADLFAVAASAVGAALRLRLTDHREGQAILRQLAPVIQEVVADACQRTLADMGSCVPVADIMAAQHERAEARLFAT